MSERREVTPEHIDRLRDYLATEYGPPTLLTVTVDTDGMTTEVERWGEGEHSTVTTTRRTPIPTGTCPHCYRGLPEGESCKECNNA